MSKPKILSIVSARPQFIKAAVFSVRLRALGEKVPFHEIIVHTGQHYDPEMSQIFFDQLRIPEPHYNLGIGSDATPIQAAKVMERLTPVLRKEKPDALLVYGDTVSTAAAAYTGALMDIPIVHVEAGERVFRRFQLPEEANRVTTDHLAALNLTCTERAGRHLRREGIAESRIAFVGDPMFDLFLRASAHVEKEAAEFVLKQGLKPGDYALATLHRKENTESLDILMGILKALDTCEFQVVLPLHPRVRDILKPTGWKPQGSLIFKEPLGYFDFMKTLLNCRLCVTDSGGVLKEAFFAKKLSIVPMDSTAWPDIVESGWACVAGNSERALRQALCQCDLPGVYPEGLFGDGRSADHMIEAIAKRLASLEQIHWHRNTAPEELPRISVNTFTISSYEDMIRTLQEKRYSFISFDEAGNWKDSDKPFVILRHDLDFDPELGLPIAEKEREWGVSSTFFILLTSGHYNPFSKALRDVVSRLLNLGHHIGLHFDPEAYCLETNEEFREWVSRESMILESVTGTHVKVVSFHRPNPKWKGGSQDLTFPRVHTYQPEFFSKIAYFSDFGGVWSNGHPLDSEAFRNHAPIQILTHPVWWHERIVSPYASLEQILDQSVERLEKSMAINCNVYRIGRFREMEFKEKTVKKKSTPTVKIVTAWSPQPSEKTPL